MPSLVEKIRFKTADIIIEVIEAAYGLERGTLATKNRETEYRMARQMASALLNKHTTLKDKCIADRLGYAGASGVSYSKSVVDNELEMSLEYKTIYNCIDYVIEKKLQSPNEKITIKIRI